jgi:Fe-S cluster assembly iron-binding protein IscA
MIHEEKVMLQITEKASEMIKDFLKNRDDPSYIRVFLSEDC